MGGGRGGGLKQPSLPSCPKSPRPAVVEEESGAGRRAQRPGHCLRGHTKRPAVAARGPWSGRAPYKRVKAPVHPDGHMGKLRPGKSYETEANS